VEVIRIQITNGTRPNLDCGTIALSTCHRIITKPSFKGGYFADSSLEALGRLPDRCFSNPHPRSQKRQRGADRFRK
jgi:hypothetical protein